MARQRKRITTNSQLLRICKLWQKRLRLSDWSITIEFCDRIESDTDDQECAGGTGWDSDRREAWVYIKRVDDDWEIITTIIHELLHIVMEGHLICQGGHDVNEERALNAVADALAEGYHQ